VDVVKKSENSQKKFGLREKISRCCNFKVGIEKIKEKKKFEKKKFSTFACESH
jgi:hypothetical protein